MNMKLLLFILGLTLCASWPAFSRNLAGSSEENNEEQSFLDFLDGEIGEYDNFADGDNDNSFNIFDLNFHLNEEGEVNTSLGEENNEEFLPEEPSDEPTEEAPEEPTEETPEEPTEETPEENNEPVVETPEENTEVVIETPEENNEAVVETPEENTENTTEEEEEQVPQDLLTQVRNDAEANDVLNFGVSTIIAQGINNTKIPNDNFTVTSISTYNKTANTKGNVYQISCVATNANGSSVLNINFTVNYRLSDQRKTLSSWSYNIKTSTPVTPITEFVQLGDDEIATETVQKVLNYGAAQIYAKGTQAGKISGSDLTISDVVSVWKQATTNGFNYKCQVVLGNDKVTVNANFTVALKSSNQQTSFIQWSYNVKNVTSNTNNNTTTPTNNTTPSNNTTNPPNNTTPSNDTTNTNTTNPTNTTNNNTTQPTTNNTTPANNTNTNNDGFVELETAEIETSGEVQGALEYGTEQIIKSGNAKGKIPVSNYTISQVNSVERKTQSNGRNTYRCDVELQDAKKVITAQFTVYVKVATQEFSIGSWTYNISNIKNSNSNGSTNNNTNTNTNTNNNTNTNTTNNNNNTNTNTNNNTSTNTTNNNNNTTQPTTNTTTPTNTTNSTATNYTALTQDEINSAEVQGALNFGADRVIQHGYDKGQIPVSNYTITKVNSVGKQVASNGRNAYKCDVELQDVNKVLVKAQFVVYVKVSTQEKTVGAWSYQVSNKGNATKPSTNTTNSTNTKTL